MSTSTTTNSRPARSPQAAQILARIAEIAPLLRSEAAEGERLTRLTEAAVDALGSAGAFGVGLPPELGGSPLPVRDQVAIFSEIARADGSAGWVGVTATQTGVCTSFGEEALEELRSVDWTGPLVAASVFVPGNGKARPVEGGWMVEGRWSFCSNVQLSAWLLTGVEFDSESGEGGRGMVLLRRGQYEIVDDWHVMGLSASNSNSARVTEPVFVPAHRVVTVEHVGRHMSKANFGYSPAAAVTALVSSLALGIARGAMDTFVDQISERPAWLDTPHWGTFKQTPAVQMLLGKSDVMLSTAESALYALADAIDAAGQAGAMVSPAEVTRGFAVAGYVGRICHEVVTSFQFQVGSSTAALSNPLQRAMRDIQVVLLHGAMRWDAHTENHGRNLLGLAATPPVMLG